MNIVKFCDDTYGIRRLVFPWWNYQYLQLTYFDNTNKQEWDYLIDNIENYKMPNDLCKTNDLDFVNRVFIKLLNPKKIQDDIGPPIKPQRKLNL